jgi:homoserine kinase type II
MAILGRYPAVARPLSEPEALGNAGGLSGARLWRYSAGLGPLVVRAWPPGPDGPTREALERLHGWLLQVGRIGFVPIPVQDREGRTVQQCGGRLWELSPWMPGAPQPARPPASVHVRAAFAALAAFHQGLAADVHTGQSSGIEARRREVVTLCDRGFDQIDRVLAGAPESHLQSLARKWLDAARPRAPGVLEMLSRTACVLVDLQPCLRDARPEHFLFSGDQVTGLIDFGAMEIESVAADVARLSSDWLGLDITLRAAALAAYASIRPLNESETALVGVFDRSADLLAGAHWVRWHFLEGRSFDDPHAVDRGIARGLERLAARDEPTRWLIRGLAEVRADRS